MSSIRGRSISDVKGVDGGALIGSGRVAGKGKLAQQFLLPPFTVLNAAAGWWQNRKSAWKDLGIRSEIGRGGNLLQLSEEAEEYRRGEGDYAKDATPGSRGKNSKYVAGTTGKGMTNSLKGGLTYGLTQNPYPKKRVQGPSQPGLVHHLTCGAYTNRGEEVKEGSDSGTSIFDPVLCELAYRWFCPDGGQVIDPFAGGSVRGIVAASLGRKYWGCDLAREQIIANEAQGQELIYGTTPQYEKVGKFVVVRDDNVPGGTKERALRIYLDKPDLKRVAYASPAQGFAQVAIARVCRDLGIEFHLFIAERKEQHPRTKLAEAYGAVLHPVSPGYLATVEARAKEWCNENATRLLPFGLHSTAFIQCLQQVVLSAVDAETGKDHLDPKEIWCAAGSGTLALALKKAYPDAHVHAVQVGRELDDELTQIKGVTVHVYDREFEKPARVEPPFPSIMEYDAKAWEVMQDKGSPGAVFWNVAADDAPLRWVNGDSRDMLAGAPEADFVFSCPPYYDLEEYSDDPADLSHMEWEDFREAYEEIITKACERLKDDRFACFVVGDVRDPDGCYRNLPGLTTACFRRAGLRLYNEATLVTAVGSLSIRTERQFVMSRKMGKTHQNVLVFVKGDPVKATDAVTGLLAEARRQELKDKAKKREESVSWGELGDREQPGEDAK